MNLNHIFLLTFLSIIFFTSLPINSQSNVITYHETPTGNGNPPRVTTIDKLDDGSLILRIIRRNSSASSEGKICVDKYLSLRTISSDGQVTEIDMTLDIQDFNFCYLQINGVAKTPIKIYPVTSKLLLITYTEAEDLHNVFTYNEWVMLVGLDRTIYGKALLGPAFVDPATNSWWPNQASITINVDHNKGFLRVGTATNTSNIICQQFIITENKEIQKLAEDDISFDNMSHQVKAIATIDGGYAVVFANSTDIYQEDPFLPQGAIYALFLTYGQPTNRKPAILFQTQIPGVRFTSLDCDIAYLGMGQTCVLTVKNNLNTTSYVKVEFLTSGTSYNGKSLNGPIPTIPGIDEYYVRSLRYGGFLLTGLKKNEDNDAIMYGYIINNGEVYSWNLQNPTITNVFGSSKVLPNNTLVLAQKEQDQSWTLITTDLYQFAGEKDHGYTNFHINTTSPAINETISVETDSLTIKYFDQIDLSIGNITIFQIDDSGREIIRQFTSGFNERVSLDADGITVYVKIIKSTFNHPTGKYFVTIDNNFVKSRTYQEPLYGIRDRVWSFTTLPNEEKNSVKATGMVRLTTDGTNYFDKLDNADRDDFYKKLRQEIAYAIPISPDRITTNGRVETDTTVSPKQIILSINIEREKNKQAITVNSAKNDLDTLIKNKYITLISSGKYTKYLDQEFGYKTSSNFFMDYGLYFFAVFAAMCVFVIIYMWAKRKNNEGRNIVILQFGIIMFDFLMDILFVSTNARAIDRLFIPSIVIVIVPFITSLGLAFTIITRENLTEEFSKWSKNNTKVVAIFTLLAGADIEILNVLESKFAGYEIFNAKFSNSASNIIFWGACLNIFIEDIPQVVVQIIYNFDVVHYNIIPLLTLLSSCLNLTVNIIGRVYNALHKFRDQKEEITSGRSTLIGMDEKSFGGLKDKSIFETASSNSSKPNLVFLEGREKNPYY
ncbi:13012_t:CDS:2 [Funneliformis mosseae]|uniref:13012_t:CDS:1 n=1 Tax=Funneliformis mosseae TaxID=27381 RepID=A0A9N9ACP1_FUNMO|nr:13012_t:CDS:2 [Funneliformis mosseae]